MSKLTDKPAARTFRVADGAPPAPARPRAPVAPPALAGAQRELPPNARGMGFDERARETLRQALRPISIGVLLDGSAGVDGTTAEFPGCDVPLRGAAYSCSQQVFEFLAANVLRNSDIIPVIRAGWVPFDRRIGVHSIPLATEDPDSLPGDFVVPDNQALIVTSVTFLAALNMPGLPGSFISIDPQSLVGQVAFFLRADNGTRPLSEQSLTAGTMAGGTEIVNVEGGDVQHPPFTDVAKQSVGAGYEVVFQPTPGFPSIVGVRMRGYMINQQLLAEALDNKSYRAGG